MGIGHRVATGLIVSAHLGGPRRAVRVRVRFRVSG